MLVVVVKQIHDLIWKGGLIEFEHRTWNVVARKSNLVLCKPRVDFELWTVTDDRGLVVDILLQWLQLNTAPVDRTKT